MFTVQPHASGSGTPSRPSSRASMLPFTADDERDEPSTPLRSRAHTPTPPAADPAISWSTASLPASATSTAPSSPIVREHRHRRSSSASSGKRSRTSAARGRAGAAGEVVLPGLIVCIMVTLVVVFTFVVGRIIVAYATAEIGAQGGHQGQSGISLFGQVNSWDRERNTLSLHFVPYWCTHGTYDCATVQEDVVFVQDAGAPETDPLALGELDRIAREAEERELAARSGLSSVPVVAAAAPSQSSSPTHRQHGGQTGKSYEFRNGSEALELVVRRDSCTPQYRRRWRSDATFPFDRYDLSFLVSASKPAPSDVQIPVVAAHIYNHVLESHWWFVVSYAPLDLSPSSAMQEEVPFDSEHQSDEKAPQLDVKIRVRRHPSIVVSAVTVFVVNWLTTVIALWLTSSTHPHTHQSQPDLSSIVIPALATVFVCVLRKLMPAAPPLGCVLDLVGIIPAVGLLLCFTAYRLYARFSHSRSSRRELYGMNPAKFDDDA